MGLNELKMAILVYNGVFLVDWSGCGMIVNICWGGECVVRVFEGCNRPLYYIFGCLGAKYGVGL